ncbi:hypothetical protein CWT12_01480 [Actinomyces sp. 432]|uniref:hypothetical protein n=1 Tax=Actinomyces sp. 432 TaxID=2057798 RepID=UPI0013744A3A|nr:hypothetical protein [Actinomyces sp. 432]QHO90273.1 hypothetical protein CWT12_01480 [Actinomyces sp. 432]
MTTTITLNFDQQLLLMEALDQMAYVVRDRVADGEIAMQDNLRKIEKVQHLLETASDVQVLTTKAAA